MIDRRQKRSLRHARVRKKIYGSMHQPRLTVFRSNKHLFVQLIDDQKGKTLASASDSKIKNESSDYQGSSGEKKAYMVGLNIAKSAVSKKIETIVFDRGGYKFHGKVKALAQGARSGGLKF